MRFLTSFLLVLLVSSGMFAAEFLKPLDMSGNAVTNVSYMEGETGVFMNVIYSPQGTFYQVDARTASCNFINGSTVQCGFAYLGSIQASTVEATSGQFTSVESERCSADTVMQSPSGEFANINAKFYSGVFADTANVVFVSKNGYADGDGSMTQPYLDLYSAVVPANSGKVVVVMPGIYYFHSMIEPPDRITIQGFSGNADTTVLVATNNTYRFFSSLDHSYTLMNLTFVGTNGGNVHGVLLRNGTVENCCFADFVTQYDSGGALNVSNCSVRYCTFLNCAASNAHAGALYSHGASTIERCLFQDCFAEQDGGAMEIHNGSVADNCEFIRCNAGYAGGVGAHSTSVVWNCRFTDCTSGGGAGAVYLVNGSRMGYCDVPRGEGSTNSISISSGFMMATVTNYGTNGFVTFSTVGN